MPSCSAPRRRAGTAGGDGGGRGLGRLDRRDAGNAGPDRRGADLVAVGPRAPPAAGRVDHEGDLAPGDQLAHVRRPRLRDLPHRPGPAGRRPPGPRPCPEVATRSRPDAARRAARATARGLSASRAEMKAAPGAGQGLARAALRLGERLGEAAAEAHHLAGRAHLGTEHRVGAGEPREREHRLLHRDLPGRAPPPAGRARRAGRRASAARRGARAGRRWPWRRTARCATRAGWPRSRRRAPRARRTARSAGPPRRGPWRGPPSAPRARPPGPARRSGRGSTHAESPEWTPAASTCSITAAVQQSAPSQRASTS